MLNGDASLTVVAEIENVIGSNFNDVLIGDNVNDLTGVTRSVDGGMGDD